MATGVGKSEVVGLADRLLVSTYRAERLLSGVTSKRVAAALAAMGLVVATWAAEACTSCEAVTERVDMNFSVDIHPSAVQAVA